MSLMGIAIIQIRNLPSYYAQLCSLGGFQMNSKSLEKIQAATPFLKWFRQYFPQSVQSQIRPYLDQPYQLALNVMDCCNGSEYRSMEEIAAAAKVNKSTACQVLSALRNGGLVIMISTSGGWCPIEADRVEIRHSNYVGEDNSYDRLSAS